MRPRIVIADDHQLIVEGLRRVLESEFEIVGVASNGIELLSQAERLAPDIVILDIVMPMLNGLEAARQLKKTLPEVKLVFLTQKLDRDYIQAAFRAEASAYLLKQSLVSELVPALHEVMAGRFFVSPAAAKTGPYSQPVATATPGALFGEVLTKRQRQVLQLVSEGKTAKEIAVVLNISPKTVEFHKAAIMNELGIRTTAELTRYALQQGISGD